MDAKLLEKMKPGMKGFGGKLIEVPGFYYKFIGNEMKVKLYSTFKNKVEAKKKGYELKKNPGWDVMDNG